MLDTDFEWGYFFPTIGQNLLLLNSSQKLLPPHLIHRPILTRKIISFPESIANSVHI